MKKFIIALCLLMLISVQASGCREISKTAETRIKKPESAIRKIAYQSLSENDRKTIIDWESAAVQEGRFKNSGDIDYTKGKYCYWVTFETNDYSLGSIIIFIDKNNYEVLGHNLRD